MLFLSRMVKSMRLGIPKEIIVRSILMGNRTKVDSIKAESQKSGIRRTLTE